MDNTSEPKDNLSACGDWDLPSQQSLCIGSLQMPTLHAMALVKRGFFTIIRSFGLNFTMNGTRLMQALSENLSPPVVFIAQNIAIWAFNSGLLNIFDKYGKIYYRKTLK